MGKPIKTERKHLGAEAALYEVTERSYIDGKIVGPGELAGNKVQYDGIPGSKLIPLNAAAEKAKAAAIEANAKRDVAPTAGLLPAELDKLRRDRDALVAERTKLETEKAALAKEQAEFAEAQKAAKK